MPDMVKEIVMPDPEESEVVVGDVVAEKAVAMSVVAGSVADEVEKRLLGESTPIMISRRFYEGRALTREEATDQKVEVRRPPPGVPVAEVEFGTGMTINLGNFESVRLDVRVKLPCVVEEVGEAYKAAKAFVDGKLNKEVADIREYRKSRKAGE